MAGIDRRTVLGAAGLAAGIVATGASTATAAEGAVKGGRKPLTEAEFERLVSSVPMDQIGLELAYESVVDIEPSMVLGTGPWGERWMVPITGGRFAGPRIQGTVLPGGADRQVMRRDGVKQLEARYELQTDDGAVLAVVNNVIIDAAETPRYARSWLTIAAPDGPHAWLNRRVLVGTLGSLRPQRDAVLIRVFALT
ncbi:DUF3237 domain-containing protein [Nocardioides albus]|uniref:UPF0311 protein FHS12_003522 n=1 Tax=Nocardioides albus TaxID=1841 RepID=A0A7W5F9Q9_9ACTN|nr:DUF3237 domain-containing protein [Nocardioides albus]MBB3090564.1 hypothetical protein [Nocardioides albus]GGU24780.1 hypothetical protein GCM10007979_24480 [Nocardioides albus]